MNISEYIKKIDVIKNEHGDRADIEVLTREDWDKALWELCEEYADYAMDHFITHRKLLDSIMSLQSSNESLRAEVERLTELEKQIDRLANFIMAEIPGEPSQSEGAIDTAIRLLKARQPK